MNYRFLGSSDLSVSVIGIGTMSWPFCYYGEKKDPGTDVDRSSIRELVQTALESGINLFDTAEGYGRGLAEELLGEALQSLGRRDEAVIVTKVGPLFDGEQGKREFNLTAGHLKSRCEASLQRLRTDRIDLYLAHRPDPLTPIAETIGAMLSLQKEGKIRHFGVSNFSRDLLAEALSYGPVIANQLPYSPIDRGIDNDLLPFYVEKGVGIMAYSPLGKGILTGKYDATHLPPTDDYRHRKFHFAPESLPHHLALADRFRAEARQLKATPAQVVLAWCLARPGISTVLPGVKTIANIRECAQAGDLVLSPAMADDLSAFPSR